MKYMYMQFLKTEEICINCNVDNNVDNLHDIDFEI